MLDCSEESTLLLRRSDGSPSDTLCSHAASGPFHDPFEVKNDRRATDNDGPGGTGDTWTQTLFGVHLGTDGPTQSAHEID
jgi:hypothetical protein